MWHREVRQSPKLRDIHRSGQELNQSGLALETELPNASHSGINHCRFRMRT